MYQLVSVKITIFILKVTLVKVLYVLHNGPSQAPKFNIFELLECMLVINYMGY